MALPRAPRPTLGRAKTLRAELTQAEKKLWKALRRDALGVRFRRQHPIGPYVADFACYTLRLVIEVDGATHRSDDGRNHDAQRDGYLRSRGWVVLRFANENVHRDLDGVVDAIAMMVRDLTESQKGSAEPKSDQRGD